MNVDIVLGAYLPATGYGGPVTKVRALAPHLEAAGCNVTVVTTQLRAPGDRSLPIGLDHTCQPATRRLRTLTSYRWSALVRWDSDAPDPDLVHVIGAWNGLCYQAMRRAFRRGLPVIWEPAGMLVARGRHVAIKRSLRPWHRYLARHAAGLVWTSEVEQQEADIEVGSTPTLVRPNTAPTAPERIDSISARARLDLPAEDLLWGYLGRIEDRKGIDTLLKAWAAAAPDTGTLVIAGPVESEQLKQRIDAAGDRVRRLPALQGDDPWHYLSAIDCLLLTPDFGENFGNVVLEAVAMGTPVICSRAVGAAEFFDDPGVVRLEGDAELTRRLRDGEVPPTPGPLPAQFEPEDVAATQVAFYRERLS